MTRPGAAALSAHSPAGFYLMVEGASIDKRAHAADPERMIWDTIEFDRAVAVGARLRAAHQQRRDPDNDTLVIVTADHETGGMAHHRRRQRTLRAAELGKAVRDYAAVFRFQPEQVLNFTPTTRSTRAASRVDPDPSRKLLLGWAAAPIATRTGSPNRVQTEAAVVEKKDDGRLWRWPTRRRREGQRSRASSSPAPSRTARRGAPADGCPADTASNRTHSPATPPATCRCRRPAPAPGSSRGSTKTRRVAETAARGGRDIRDGEVGPFERAVSAIAQVNGRLGEPATPKTLRHDDGDSTDGGDEDVAALNALVTAVSRERLYLGSTEGFTLEQTGAYLAHVRQSGGIALVAVAEDRLAGSMMSRAGRSRASPTTGAWAWDWRSMRAGRVLAVSCWYEHCRRPSNRGSSE